MKLLYPFFVASVLLVNYPGMDKAIQSEKAGIRSTQSADIIKTAQPATKIYAKSFGFLPSSSAAKNTLALQQISTRINTGDGGITLIIDKGVYRVGNEVFANDTTKGYSYSGMTMLKITGCSQPVIIEGNGATIKLADGLHFGAFHAKSGIAFIAKSGGFYNRNYAAYPQSMIELNGNKSVFIRGLVVDGNVQSLILGGYWGDTGIQLPADGIFGINNEELIVDGVTYF